MQRRLPAGISLGKKGQRRPVEIAAARGKEREETVGDEARKRHGRFQLPGCAQGKADIFIAELGLEACRCVMLLGDELAVGLIDRRAEQRVGESRYRARSIPALPMSAKAFPKASITEAIRK